MRAVSVRVNEVVGVAGYVLPGHPRRRRRHREPDRATRADTTSKVVLSNVQVLTAGTRMEQDQEEGKPMQVTVVTLLVNSGTVRAPRAGQHRRQDSARAAQSARHRARPRRPASAPPACSAAAAAPPGHARGVIVGAAQSASPATSSDDAGTGGAADRGNHPRRQALDRNHQVAGTQMRRSRHMTRKFTSAVAGLILVILVAGPEAQQQAPAFGTRRGSQRPARRRAAPHRRR